MEIIIAFLLGLAAGFMMFRTGRNKPAGSQGPTVIFAGVSISDNLINGVIKMIELKEGQKAELIVKPLTARGNPAVIEPGSARWSSSDESVVSIEVDPADELKATIRGVDGSANEGVVIEFHADGDRSEGVKAIVGTMSAICTQGDAVTVQIDAGVVVDDTEAGEPQPEPIEDEPAATETGNESPAVSDPPAEVETDPGAGEVDPVKTDEGDPAVSEGKPDDWNDVEKTAADISAPSNDITGPGSVGGTF